VHSRPEWWQAAGDRDQHGIDQWVDRNEWDCALHATKSAIHGLTKVWAAEHGPSGIRVSTIAPGPTSTENVEKMKQYLQPIIDGIPSRQFSTPEQIGAAAVFLASDDAINIHSSTLSVGGGFAAV